MLSDYDLFVTQLVTLWIVLDPIGHLPLFLTATAALNPNDRRLAARVGVGLAFLILAFFSLLGQFLLHAMGISLLSFQIAGGIILFLFAISMVLGTPGAAATAAGGENSALSVAVHPLATPIIAGPGSLLTMVLLMDNNRFSAMHQGITLLALAAVLTLMLAVFLLGEPIRRFLGSSGSNVLRRIMGLILAALAVNMILSAVAVWLHLPEI
ncbi:MarC family protein [Muricoccus aerilatus]|uniref:MarC family protein n=1 Tax=Muricoccus aerilatus TaxID=452982 RepID=UPI0005C229B3|nr:MarC family protein [Roseomonas aerilata]